MKTLAEIRKLTNKAKAAQAEEARLAKIEQDKKNKIAAEKEAKAFEKDIEDALITIANEIEQAALEGRNEITYRHEYRHYQPFYDRLAKEMKDFQSKVTHYDEWICTRSNYDGDCLESHVTWYYQITLYW